MPTTQNVIASLEFGIQNSEFRTRFCILHSAFCILLLAGCGPTAEAQPKAAAGVGAQQANQSLEVVIAGKPVRKPLVLSTSQPARVEPIEQTPIQSKLAGYVGQVLVDFGDRVKKDQPLLILSAPEVDADLAQKKALLEQAKSELVQAEAGLAAAEADVLAALAGVKQTEARIEKTKADVDRWHLQCKRIEELAASGSVNRQLLEEAQQQCSASESAHQEALAAVESAKSAVAQSRAHADKSAADIEAAKARIRVAEANLAHASAVHSYLSIQSPFDGVVTRRAVDPGHFVQPGTAASTPLLVVARTDKMRVFAAVPEIEAALVDVGDEATVEVQSLRGKEFPGKVTRTSFAIEPTSRSLEAIMDIDNQEDRLRPGMFAMAKIILQEEKDALTLPTAAVARRGKDAFCYKLIGGKAIETPLKLGIKVNDDFQVIEGLADSDTVILNKASTLKDGQPVELLKTPAR
jgi:RND family efflux transporter MFP subunit